MNNRQKQLWVAGVCILTFFHCVKAQTLIAGSDAPPINVLAWLKGDALQNYQPGKIYIIEFTASHCVPCRAAAKHLTELSERYKGEVTVAGICVGENGDEPDLTDVSYLPRVKDFVNKMGDRMGYNVAVDGPEQTMRNTWLKAAGREGIPVAFVIDKNARISWIGHPLSGDMEKVIDDLLSDKVYDRFRDKVNDSDFEANLRRACYKNDYKSAVLLVDSQIKQQPNTNWWRYRKFEVMLQFNEPEAYKYAWHLLHNECKNEEAILLYIARLITHNSPHSKIKLLSPDYRLAIAVTKRGYEVAQENMMKARYLHLLAETFIKTGDRKSAVLSLRNAIDTMAVYDKSDVQAREFLSVCQSLLKKYQEAD